MKLNLRKKQLHVLFTALHQLQSSIETEAPIADMQGSQQAPLVDLTDDAAAAAQDASVDMYADMDCSA